MEYNSAKTQAAWDRYVATSEPIPDTIDGVRQEIVESWRRSKGKADPFALKIKCVSDDALIKIEQENNLLIQIAYPYLLEFYEHLRHAKHLITLTDKNGCQIKRISDDKQLIEMSFQKQLTNGCMFSESEIGTCGIGTCLATEKPAMILGAEHFHHMYSTIACYAAPIYSPTKELIGCLNITGPLDAYQPLIMGMLGAAASGIEKEFQLTQTNRMLNSTLESCDSGVLLLDADKSVLHYNQLALDILCLQQDDILGESIFSVIQEDSIPVPFRRMDKEAASIGCTLLNRHQIPLDVNLTIKPGNSNGHGLDTTLLLFNSQKYIHRLTNKLVGFSASCTFDSIIGTSSAIQSAKSLGLVAAGSSSPVLIFGENGTGKKMFAQAIHNASDRSGDPFVVVNCGSIPKSLLESELFGYEGGAFSGAKEDGHPGKFELANGGTLFLDEISNLPLDLQTSLLRVLQTREIFRLGGQRSKAIDVKLITATDANLLAAVQGKTFRDDLYYRLNAINMVIPPLRERTEDIAAFVDYFTEQYSQSMDKPVPTFDSECMDALLSYHWPGNVRELENVIERLINVSEGPIVQLINLPTDLLNHYYADKRGEAVSVSARDYLNGQPVAADEDAQNVLSSEVQEYNTLVNTLQKEHGYVKTVAIALNIPLSTLYRKLNKYKLNPKDYRVW